jgi:hypothetical protein
MQSLICVGTISSIEQPSHFAQPIADLVQPATSLMIS